MSERLYRTGFTQGREIWPILGLFLLAILVPTVCLLWFMTEAVRNERMAVQQKVSEMYGSHLNALQQAINDFWEQKGENLQQVYDTHSPDRVFLTIVEKGIADSVVLYDGKGRPAYPAEHTPSQMPSPAMPAQWPYAQSLEYAHKDYSGAAKAYAEVAAKASEDVVSVMALRAQIRCLVKAGKKSEAMGIIKESITHPEYKNIRDGHGHLVAPDLQLYLLRLLQGTGERDFGDAMDALAGRLRDYGAPSMPSSQRLFLMEELQAIGGDIEFPTLAAERLAQEYLQVIGPLPTAAFLVPSLSLDCVSRVLETKMWQMPLAGQRAIALFFKKRIMSDMQALIDRSVSLPDARIALLLNSDSAIDPEPFLSVAAGPFLPDFRLNLYLDKSDFFAAASERQIAIYVWTAFLVIGILAVLAVLAVRLILRQMRLTRLKNDIVATVSHELKTPLASMRVLVDTLLDGRYGDKAFVKDYLELISRENDRLSRMIDSFLTFSRMERKKHDFDFKEIDPADVVNAVHESVKKRFDAGGFTLAVDVSPDMPTITADRDGLIIVLLNLLDNAYTYAYDGKQVSLCAYLDKERVCFEIKDNGVGMSQKEIKKVLNPFYQSDQSLSRHGTGCGLGLSIVKSIVDAHGGSISITSERGKGSVFVVEIPIK